MNITYFFHTKVLILLVFIYECLKFYFFKREKVMKKIYCSKCANLLLPKIKEVITICVADCEFVGGIIQEKIDITGIKSPLDKNKNNNCKEYIRFPRLSTLEFKKIILNKLKAKSANINELGANHERKAINNFERPIESDESTRNTCRASEGTEDTNEQQRIDDSEKCTNLPAISDN